MLKYRSDGTSYTITRWKKTSMTTQEIVREAWKLSPIFDGYSVVDWVREALCQFYRNNVHNFYDRTVLTGRTNDLSAGLYCARFASLVEAVKCHTTATM